MISDRFMFSPTSPIISRGKRGWNWFHVSCMAVVQLLVTVAVVHLVCYPVLETAARADVESTMNDYFSGMGAAANITGATAYQGQAGGFYSGGNVMVRFPQKSINFANVQLPNVRAGCGGIDIFTGSFSFVNSAEIVALMKAIANNAVGFAFKLAIDGLCPECGQVMESMRQAAQLLNQQMMNSCETAQALVGGMWPKSDAASRSICEAIGTNDGFFSDWARGRQQCGTGGQRASTVAAASAEFNDVNTGVPVNFTWEALKKNKFFAPGGTIDVELAEYVMTVVGTVIVMPAEDSSPGKVTPFVGDGGSTLITALLDGTGSQTISVLKCDTTDKCLNPTSETRTISPSAAIRPKVRAMVVAIAGKVVTDQPLSAAEQGLLQMVTIPLYKILTVQAAYSRGGQAGDVDSLVEMASLSLMFAITDQLIGEVGKSKSTFQRGDAESIKLWSDNVENVRSGLRQREQLVNQRGQTLLTWIQSTQFFERQIQANLTPSLSASLDWSRAVSGRGSF